MTIAAASEDSPESWREKDISLPTDARVLAELLEVRPWQTIADLMEKGVFASQQTAIQDEEVVRSIGKKHGVLFRIANNPEQTGPPNP